MLVKVSPKLSKVLSLKGLEMRIHTLFGAFVVGVACLSTGAVLRAAGPVYVDLSSVANTSLQDDATAGNDKGGWSDEGPNDMLIYPEVTFGEVKRNGYMFKLAKPAQVLSPTVVMLKGANKGTGKPEKVEVAVADAKGAYVYMLLNAVGSVRGEQANYVAATCKVEYADGTSAVIELRDGVELKQWYVGEWWDNAGEKAWPFFMGRNLYSIKWGKYIGVWAMQWKNPSPEKGIKKLVFESMGKATPIVWAVTIDDADYRADAVELKKDFVRPAGIPEGFYDARLEMERAGQYKAALGFELIQGVRRVDVIKDDLIAVTVDGGLGEIGAGEMRSRISAYAKPEAFVVKNGETVIPATQVVRQSYETFQGNIPGFMGVTLYWHTFYLKLGSPMQAGAQYTVSVPAIDKGLTQSMKVTFDDKTTQTAAIKVNQVDYSSKAKKRYAYLGWWAAEMGAVDYSGFKAFEVIDEKSGKAALKGEIKLRKKGDALSGEDVYEMDIAALPVGKYHIYVPGLGRSDSFGVGGEAMKGLYYDTMRAFYHQRAGVALTKPYTTFERPATYTQVYESGYTVENKDYAPKPGEKIKTFRGGYHDAGDDDVFTYHLRATAQTLDAFERAGGKLKDGDLNIPESGNKIPDVLDEADWALRCYLELQNADGSVPMGRGNDQDLIRNNYKGKARPAYGVLPPINTSSTEFAAVAAKYARAIRAYDSKRADEYVAAAEKALMWAVGKQVDPDKVTEDRPAYLFQAWAAAELFETTGDAKYNDIFLRLYKEGRTQKVHWSLGQWIPQSIWTYGTSKQAGVDVSVQKEIQKRIIESANWGVKRTDENAYRMGNDGRGLGWGNGNGGGHFGDILMRAYWLTGDQKYFDAASLNADFLLGANPISRTFVTGVGARFPRQPQLHEALYTKSEKRGETVRGITNYGLSEGGVPGWPVEIPKWRRVRDIGGGAEASSEFTVTETLGGSGMLFEFLWGAE
jgi:endoglucanase